MAGETKYFYVYILTNKRNTVLYTGVTGDLRRRVSEHRLGLGGQFTSRYKVTKLIYFEKYESAYEAIVREKKIKAGSRRTKTKLVEAINPEWTDLAEEFLLL